MENERQKIGVAIDVETTGLKAGIQEIVSIAFIAHDEDFYPTEKFKTKIRPMRPELADNRALIINGLSLVDLKKEPTPQQVRNAFFQWHEEVLEDKLILALGHNFAFDQRFLKIFFGDFYDNVFHYKFRDTYVLVKGLQDCGYLRKDLSLKLVSLCKYFNILHNAHDAYEDALATLKLYQKLVNLLKEKL